MGMSASTFEVHAFQCHVGCLAIGMGCLLASDFSYLIVLAASIFFAVYVGRSMGRGNLNLVYKVLVYKNLCGFKFFIGIPIGMRCSTRPPFCIRQRTAHSCRWQQLKSAQSCQLRQAESVPEYLSGCYSPVSTTQSTGQLGRNTWTAEKQLTVQAGATAYPAGDIDVGAVP